MDALVRSGHDYPTQQGQKTYSYVLHQTQKPVGGNPVSALRWPFHLRHQLVENFRQLRESGEVVVNNDGHTVGK